MTDAAEAGQSSIEPPTQAADRAAAFAAGPGRVPKKFAWIVLGVAAVLGLGGVLGEHVVSALGINPTPSGTTAPPSHAIQATQLHGALPSLLGLSKLTPDLASPIVLTDQQGKALSLSDELGRVVVLTFFDARCNDICPILAAEIRTADADLGRNSAEVSFLTVNTDPGAVSSSPLSPALARTGLGKLANWHMLSGSVSELDDVWKSYGVLVAYNPATGQVTHNDVMYFLDQTGHFRYSATPFANEKVGTGTYSLPKAVVRHYGEGIATYASSLVDNE